MKAEKAAEFVRATLAELEHAKLDLEAALHLVQQANANLPSSAARASAHQAAMACFNAMQHAQTARENLALVVCHGEWEAA